MDKGNTRNPTRDVIKSPKIHQAIGSTATPSTIDLQYPFRGRDGRPQDCVLIVHL